MFCIGGYTFYGFDLRVRVVSVRRVSVAMVVGSGTAEVMAPTASISAPTVAPERPPSLGSSMSCTALKRSVPAVWPAKSGIASMSIDDVEPKTFPISKKPSLFASSSAPRPRMARVAGVGLMATNVSSTSGPTSKMCRSGFAELLFVRKLSSNCSSSSPPLPSETEPVGFT